ncbi:MULTISPECIES: type IV toxin-antitoxin system AbiEi family antitoxin domain-containing protein [unclassified Kribbella]|uniref:type IV toxin-antitoxin system AbiEi family antitoxin domain-containing protein n=1 Tax=unclassified Kribbella TaxID=2644121 RepID=UPI003076D93C
MSEVIEVVRRRGGTATFAELRASVSGRAIRRALAIGAIRRIAKGVYAMPPAADPLAAARAQAGIVSHLSAAVLHGFSVLDLPAKPQITVPRGQHRRLSPVDCELHWADDVPSDGRLTGKLRTVLDCARTLPFTAGLTVADSALRLDAFDRSQLLVGAAELRGPGCRRARRVAAAADGRAESPLESVLRALLIEAGIEGFEPQVVVQDHDFSARIDLGHRGLLIAVEADSFAHHGTRRGLTRDCRRHVNLTIRGWRLLRFSWEDVMFDPAWVVDAIRQAMAGSPGHHNAREIVDASRGRRLSRQS